MFNKILTSIIAFSIILTILNACGAGYSGGEGGTYGPKPSLTATVLLPNESDGSLSPGDFTVDSCQQITISSICAIKLTWSNLLLEESGSIAILTSTFDYTGNQYYNTRLACDNQIKASHGDGSCIIKYDFSAPFGKNYESSPTFIIKYGSISYPENYLYSNSIYISTNNR